MKEFGFFANGAKEVVLGDEIEICEDKNAKFIVANSRELDAEIYAPEVNFYINSTSDEMLEIAKNVSLLYEARGVMFDNGQDSAYQKEVGKNVILVSDDGRENLQNLLQNAGFKVICLTHNEIKFLYGEVGELFVTVLSPTDEYEVQADFFLVENAKSYQLRQSGCYEISGRTDDEILQILQQNSPIFHYKNNITFDENICQYTGRRHELCAKCAEICPTVAILKDDENRRLEFSHIDCIKCGRCVSVCPSGALQSAQLPRAGIWQMSKLYKGKIPLLICESEICDDLELNLPKNVLPFAFVAPKQLDEVNLLTIMQESGSQIVLYGDIGEVSKDALSLVNSVSKAIYGAQAVLFASNKNELKTALNLARNSQKWEFSLNETNLAKREILSKRIAFMVADSDFGVVSNTSSQSYGKIKINENSCTLCLSCVGACNTGALFADKSDNSIKFNASLCTTCNYCVLSCAEKDTMALELSGIELRREFFEYQILAHDELFACIECGKEFATKKAVMKIANMMSAHFSDDPQKAKTLLCCADCKAKLMILAQIEEANKEIL